MDGLVVAVVSGLAVGIAFVFAIASVQMLPISMRYPIVNQSYEDRLANAAYHLPEVQAFREKFPQVSVTGYTSSDFGGVIVCYAYPPPIPCDHVENDERITAYIEIRMDEKGQPINFTIYCNSGNGTDGSTAARIDVRSFLREATHCPK